MPKYDAAADFHALTWGTRHYSTEIVGGGSHDKLLLPLYIQHHLFNGKPVCAASLLAI